VIINLKKQPNTPQLHTYVWAGINNQGERIRGENNALSPLLLKADLRRQGITPKSVRKKSRPLFSLRKKIHPKEITLFVRQMATMLTAGIPIVQAFDLIAHGQTNPVFQQLLLTIKTQIEAGSPPSDAFRKHPHIFNPLLCNLIEAGEQSGTLDTMLKRIASYREKTELLSTKVKKACIYPAAVIIVAILVTAILMVFVVPQFESLFKGFGADLPTMTLFVIRLSSFMQTYAGLLFGFIVLAILGFLHALKRSEKCAWWFDRRMLHLPILGAVLSKAIIARFARTLSTTFAAGLPLSDALKAVSGATGNRIYAHATLKIRDTIGAGQSLQIAMANTQLFPPMALQMVMIGEESGTLESMLSKIADFYEAEVDTTVDSLSSLLEPAILVILGVLVGRLVIAMYLPIFKLGNVV
jgi:type IV pilus assembly protein PilC